MIRLLSEFPDKNWKLGSIDSLLKRIRKTGTIVRQRGSGRPRSAHSDDNIEKAEDLVLSREYKPICTAQHVRFPVKVAFNV